MIKKLSRTCCYRKIIVFRVGRIALLHHITSLLIILSLQHHAVGFIPDLANRCHKYSD